jgi:hypothetical protein
MIGMDHGKRSRIVHRKMVMKGYWAKPRELGTILMLIVTELSKAFDENRANKDQKLVDIVMRLYDITGRLKVDLNELPEVESTELIEFLNDLTNVLEADRVDMGDTIKHINLRNCLARVWKEAEKRNYNLEWALDDKFNMIDEIKKRNY